MIEHDHIDTIPTEELTSIQTRINKELERRNGGDVDIKKVRAQVYRLAVTLGCEWIADSHLPDSTHDADKPKRRGRKPKTEEQQETQDPTLANGQVAMPPGSHATAPAGNTPVEEEKRRLWPL
ncbi:MAG: hypothetical protein ACREUI_06375 [Burkholderiales bacterium]